MYARFSSSDTKESSSKSLFHAAKARSAYAVTSALLRSKGRCPQPRQNVGMPPSLFWRSRSQEIPAFADALDSDVTPRFQSASNAPEVSSASGTAPGSGVHPQPPGAADV